MKLTKWLVGVLMVVSLMFAVGCSKDDDKGGGGGGGLSVDGINDTWAGTFFPAESPFTGRNVEVTAVVSGNSKIVFSGGFTGEGKISNLTKLYEKDGQAAYEGDFEINGKKEEGVVTYTVTDVTFHGIRVKAKQLDISAFWISNDDGIPELWWGEFEACKGDCD